MPKIVLSVLKCFAMHEDVRSYDIAMKMFFLAKKKKQKMFMRLKKKKREKKQTKIADEKNFSVAKVRFVFVNCTLVERGLRLCRFVFDFQQNASSYMFKNVIYLYFDDLIEIYFDICFLHKHI